ncbi:aldehyde dehydrogenase family protein [Falsigemmobacter faecalis]|uniref:Aldehyde dehydrogenase family protein n=1 Tax=Falsigemmobacter faecalis TaxID=2488730 RepID=A0A3P3DHB4_9RHOB|nr:aldehyde dehydrogenase family protein [Falsigemmobacter faecalis]RRH73214.1 aldehyde dehydrogenase family protein [Falsigemmobacter faecalis]
MADTTFPDPARSAHVVLGGECLRLNPADGSIASRVPALRAAEARRIANQAAMAFPAWSETRGADRAAILRRAVDLLDARAGSFRRLMREEIGATVPWAEFNLAQGRAQLLCAADLATSPLLGESEVGGHLLRRAAAGVCLGIAPWNAPLALGIRAIAMALACGNSVILKASELCAGTHLEIGRLLRDAGLPEGVLSVVTHAPEHAREVVEALISHTVVRRVNFTGSTRVGREVAQMAAGALKRCLLGLSGKAALIVLEDADLDAAAEAAAWGAFVNQGQVCMSTDRIILAEAIADDFLARFLSHARRMTPESGAMGPVISAASVRRLSDLIQEARARGVELLCGGTASGVLMEATVLDGADPSMRVWHEELFGPLVVVCRAESDEDAVSLANDCAFGLSAAIWSRDLPRAKALAARIDAGMCHINQPTVLDDAALPVGGVKNSGYGRFGTTAALEEFTEVHWTSIGPHSCDSRTTVV